MATVYAERKVYTFTVTSSKKDYFQQRKGFICLEKSTSVNMQLINKEPGMPF